MKIVAGWGVGWLGEGGVPGGYITQLHGDESYMRIRSVGTLTIIKRGCDASNCTINGCSVLASLEKRQGALINIHFILLIFINPRTTFQVNNCKNDVPSNAISVASLWFRNLWRKSKMAAMSDANNVMHENRATFRLNWTLSATSSSK